MTKPRHVQLSAFPDLQPGKPIGYILPSVFQGTNADLMAAVAPYYLTGSVCDLTYGEPVTRRENTLRSPLTQASIRHAAALRKGKA